MIGTPDIKFSNGILNVFDFTKKVKFQPLYVGDLAKFIIETHHEKNKYTISWTCCKNFAEIFDVILKHQGKAEYIYHYLFFIAKQVAFFLETS